MGDGGLGIGPNPQSPIPNPQSPIPNYPSNKIKNKFNINEYILKNIILYYIINTINYF